MVNALDRQAERLNISRQAVIKSMLDAQLRLDDGHWPPSSSLRSL
jgi:hypothetical protein